MSKSGIRKRMRKFWLVLALAMGCLLVASLWESSLSDWSVDSQVALFQDQLQAEEKHLDEQLQKLDENTPTKSPRPNKIWQVTVQAKISSCFSPSLYS